MKENWELVIGTPVPAVDFVVGLWIVHLTSHYFALVPILQGRKSLPFGGTLSSLGNTELSRWQTALPTQDIWHIFQWQKVVSGGQSDTSSQGPQHNSPAANLEIKPCGLVLLVVIFCLLEQMLIFVCSLSGFLCYLLGIPRPWPFTADPRVWYYFNNQLKILAGECSDATDLQ